MAILRTSRRVRREAAAGLHESQLELGERVVRLLVDPSWIVRRVETVSLRVDGETRRRVSFDLAVPRSLAVQASEIPTGGTGLQAEVSGEVRGSQGDVAVVPLCFMRKGSLIGLDAVDEAGRSLPVLSSSENAVLAIAAVQHLVERLAGTARLRRPQVDDAVAAIVRSTGQGDDRRRRKVLTQLGRALAGDRAGDAQALAVQVEGDSDTDLARIVTWLARVTTAGDGGRRIAALIAAMLATLSDSYVFAVQIDSAVALRRTIVKVAYASSLSHVDGGLRRAGWGLLTTERLRLSVAARASRSTHIEIETTPSVQVKSVEQLVGTQGRHRGDSGSFQVVRSAGRYHLMAQHGGPHGAVVDLLVTVVPRRYGTVVVALVGAILNLVLQGLGLLLGQRAIAAALDRERVSDDPPVASEVVEHLWLLRDTNSMTIVTLVLSLVAALLVVVQLNDVERRVTAAARWVIGGAAVLFSSMLLALSFQAHVAPDAVDAVGMVLAATGSCSVVLGVWAMILWGRAAPRKLLTVAPVRQPPAPQRPVDAAGVAATEAALFTGFTNDAIDVVRAVLDDKGKR
ncbi:hypothetical protein [Cellulomonas bogoriensis]|uniref:Uncharacterized protein n=1 Tax=Cellulomonas bogoriensis 69B4 = DSM 16987 TaxID=1386082 RepID=A0A0A0C500_9CELL|nr:hypothetical protein [Cellulomonas bogoriensis]KGM14449.1 hypothetical protein N869_11110 [Cellulomonas bogoriensis 69B4 = DSM 16987]